MTVLSIIIRNSLRIINRIRARSTQWKRSKVRQRYVSINSSARGQEKLHQPISRISLIKANFKLQNCRPVDWSSQTDRINPCGEVKYFLSSHTFVPCRRDYQWECYSLGAHNSLNLKQQVRVLIVGNLVKYSAASAIITTVLVSKGAADNQNYWNNRNAGRNEVLISCFPSLLFAARSLFVCPV